MPASFLFYADDILVAWVCIPRNFLTFNFLGKCFFIFVAKGKTGQSFEK